MSLWRETTRGLRNLFHRAAADRDLADEISHFLDESAADLRSRGLTPADAARLARANGGNPAVMAEHVRSHGWERLVETTLGDAAYALRRLRRDRTFALVSILTLALGIGASTAIFSAVNPILFAPLPYPEPSRITMISDTGNGGVPVSVTFGTYREILQRSRSFDALAPCRAWQPALVGTGEPERLEGQRVGAEFFRALGVRPAIGRDFDASEDRIGGPKVAILSDRIWRRRFGGDPAIVGRDISLDAAPFRVVGIMPAAFDNVVRPVADVWAPLQYDTILRPDAREWGHHLRMIGRLRAGVSLAAARNELTEIAKTPRPDFPRVPWASLNNGLIVATLQSQVTQQVRPALLAILTAVLLVLVIACANVTNLLLARGAQRGGELAMRAALGAGRGRLIRQLVTETMVLGFAGGACGVLVAQTGVKTLVALSPPGLPRANAIRLDGTVFLFGLVVTLIFGLAAGLVSALHASRGDVQRQLQKASRRAARGHDFTRQVLVVGEVALALTLLVSAGLLWRSLHRVFSQPPGFDAANVVTLQIQHVGRGRPSNAATFQYFADVLDRVKHVPGVDAAGFTAQVPLSGDSDVYGVHFERDTDSKNDSGVLRYAVTPEYFEAMRIPLRRGRLLTPRDTDGAPRVVLLSESFAQRVFQGADPIGQRLRIGPSNAPWFTVAGVVGNVKQNSLGDTATDAVYLTTTQWLFADTTLSVVARTRGDAAALAPSIRQAIWSVDKDQPVLRVAAMERLVERSEADRRFALTLFEAFAIAALALAGIGLFGILSGAVTERTREIGIRAALGASRSGIVRLVMRQGLTLTGIGAVLGVAGAAAASRGLVTLLFGTSQLDPLTYLVVVGSMFVVAAIACWAPAWRASRIDPAVTLRAE